MQDRTHDFGVGVKLSLPGIPAHQHNRRGIGLIVFGQENAAQKRSCSQHWEIVAGNKKTHDGLSAALKQLRELEAGGSGDAGGGLRTSGRQVGRSDGHAEGKQRKIRERSAVVAIVEVIGIGKSAIASSGSDAREDCQAVGILYCSRAQDKRVKGCKRSEEHTSELQSHSDLVCRLLLEKKKPTT